MWGCRHTLWLLGFFEENLFWILPATDCSQVLYFSSLEEEDSSECVIRPVDQKPIYFIMQRGFLKDTKSLKVNPEYYLVFPSLSFILSNL
jgi:hypothetical protein